MNARYLFTVLILMSVFLAGCSAAATQVPAQNSSFSGARSNSPAAPTAAPPAGADSASAFQRVVIKNASLEIVVEAPDQALQSISSMAEQMSGFVVTSSLYKVRNSDGIEIPQAKITVRVPAQRLNEALDKIHALVKNTETDISNENVTGQDVTEDYVDLNSRLVNLQSTEKQLQQIMQTTAKTEDALAVFRELTNVRQEIEVTQGKIKFYERSASLSAIDVSILAREIIAPVQVAGWQPVGVARDALQALIGAGKFLVNLVIWLGIFVLPLGLVMFFPVRYLRKQIKRFSRKPGSKAPMQQGPN